MNKTILKNTASHEHIEKIDVFAHVLPQGLVKKIKKTVPDILTKMPFLDLPALSKFEDRRSEIPSNVRQVISNVSLNPEDFFDPEDTSIIVKDANNELIDLVKENPGIFIGAVGMLPMNNPTEAIRIIEEQILTSNELFGVQLFTKALGKSITDESFKPIFEKLSDLNIPIWLHPVFDDKKRENNITFSWEYELTLAMYDIVKFRYFQKYPNLKIIVHHGGAMIPFFSERIKHTMTPEENRDFKKFYVDTALLGNTKALELTGISLVRNAFFLAQMLHLVLVHSMLPMKLLRQ